MPTYSSMIPVMERHRFDTAKLDAYLFRHIAGYRGGLEVRQFDSGHSNPTFFLSAEMEDGKRRAFVLRKKPPGQLVPSAHQVDREYRVITALAKTGVPVARTHVLCADESVIGQMFYVMDAVEGRIFNDPAMAQQSKTEREAIFDSMNEVLARLHQVDVAAVGLGDYGRTGQYVARQIARWSKQYAELKTERIEAMEKLTAWLPAHIPAEDPTSIVHGDYRLGNIIIHPTEPRVVAVLDWELSTLGHPLCDLAYNCLGYHLPDPPHGYANVDFRATGIPTEAEYVDAYRQRTGRQRIDNWNFYLAFSLYRLAAIAQGVYRRGLSGNAANAESIKMSNAARERAELAWSLVG